MIQPKIHPSWAELLNDQFQSASFLALKTALVSEKKQHVVYPPSGQIFRAFDLTPVDNVRVVILGQDPYHGPGQAHGLSFSVPQGVRQPPSLGNILKELHTDLGVPIPVGGDLTPWAQQGVLLINATLTVRKSSPGSHQKFGWETFTDTVIKELADSKEHLVFILWGNFARAKKALINSNKHLILEAAHPSPFSAHKGFFGCRHFSKANDYLSSKGMQPIDWSLPE